MMSTIEEMKFMKNVEFRAFSILLLLTVFIFIPAACGSESQQTASTTTVASTTTAPPIGVDTLTSAGCNFVSDTNGWDCWGPDFKGIDLTGADLASTDLSGAILIDADFTGAILRSSDLSGVKGLGTNFSGADLTGADLTGSSFDGANLSGVDLSEVDLTYADLSRAILSGVDFSGGFLPGIMFTDADLSGADFTGAHLSGADFTGANLSGADFTGAHLSETDYTVGTFAANNWTGPSYLGPAVFTDAVVTETLICSYSLLKIDLPSDSDHIVADEGNCPWDVRRLEGRIVFVSEHYGYDRSDPLAPWNAEDETTCTSRGGNWHSWSPLYPCRQDTEIFIMSPDGSGLHQLTDNDHNESGPEISPDGDRIVYNSQNNIFVMNDDGSDIRQLTQNPDGEFSSSFDPTWSPNGTHIAFARKVLWDRGYADMHGSCNPCWVSKIHVMRDDGTELRQLTFNDQAAVDAGQTGDVRRPLQGGDLSDINAATDIHPAWSPDGTQLAFVRIRPSYSNSIGVMSADGKDMVFVHALWNEGEVVNSQYSAPMWSSDGASIVFADTAADAPPYVWSIALDGFEPSQIPLGVYFDNDIRSFSLSPEGDAVAVKTWDYLDEIVVLNPPTGAMIFTGQVGYDMSWGK